jgi:large subunit ribosomal protein L9
MKNQLLLLEDVHNVGRKGDLVKVKTGFARYFLIPKQIAFVADRSVVKIQAKLK